MTLTPNNTPTNDVALKACPFCGGERFKFELDGMVRCQSCCADGPFYDGGPDDDWQEKVIALWNTRTPSPTNPTDQATPYEPDGSDAPIRDQATPMEGLDVCPSCGALPCHWTDPPAQGIEAGTVETERLDAKHESPVGNADAPNPSRNEGKDER